MQCKNWISGIFIFLSLTSMTWAGEKYIISADDFFSLGTNPINQEAYILNHDNTDPEIFQASVDLPVDSIITKVKMDCYDNTSTGSIECALKYYHTDDMITQIVTTVTSSDSSSDPQKIKQAIDEKAGKKKFMYLELTMDGNVVGQEELKFYRITLTYEPDED